MITISDPVEMQRWSQSHKRSGKKIGFLPTMGALHRGHLELADALQEHAESRVVSIFVNPTQFNDPKDYHTYPTPLERDLELLGERSIDVAFTPTSATMYGQNAQTWVDLERLSSTLEGSSRPGHFRGVTTIVSKLFNCVLPDVAIFGEKDFQQVRVIEQMIEDLLFPIQLLRGPLIRDEDGLALSSRNVRLSPEGRIVARAISRGLFAAVDDCQAGEKRAEILIARVLRELESAKDIAIEYVAIVDEQTLKNVAKVDRPCRCLVAARVDGVRLIDNCALL